MKTLLIKIMDKILFIRNGFRAMFNKFISVVVKPPKVMSTDDTLNKIVLNKCSISRYGDGEFSLMSGRGIIFQPYIPELGKRLRDIIKIQKENFIVGIPNIFLNVEWFEETSKKYWYKYLNQNRFKIYTLIERNNIYYDSLVTRLYMDYKDKSRAKERFDKIKMLWNMRDIVIIEGEKSRLGIGNDLFSNVKSLKRILCPSENAFSKYKEILDEVAKLEKSKLILISLGPTATILAYDLAELGFQAIDIGHIDIEYEWYKQRATEKRPVKYKYIGEIPNGNKVDIYHDNAYENEIIAQIS